MTHRAIGLAILAGLLAVPCMPLKAQSGNIEQVLLQLERDWEQANAKNDLTALERILAPEFVTTDSDGRVTTRAERMARGRSGAVKFQSFAQDDYKVRVIGDTAIITGRVTQKGVRDGKDMSGQERFTDTFMRRGGQWQAVASQSTRIAKP
jgi:ketosteroid isomerase-like protein